jgi:hypothetical protein
MSRLNEIPMSPEITEETLHLPAGRTVKEAIAVAVKHRRMIWGVEGRGLSDNQRMDLLVERCTTMCSKDKPSGLLLARLAIWN